MKFIIDVAEEIYERCREYKLHYGEAVLLEGAVANGTPLPKGHGRLIDADEIQFENTEFDTYGDYCIAFDAIDQADTIIEADKGE